MAESEFEKAMEEYTALQCTEANLSRKQQELEAWKKELEAQEKELCEQEKQLLTKREKLHKRMTDAQSRWESLKAELDELLYEPYGIITQLRDGYNGPFSVNEQVKALCGEACKLLAEQGYADITQFNYFILLIWELSIRLDDSTSGWLPDYLDELTDIIIVPEG